MSAVEFSSSISETMCGAIMDELRGIESDENVRILFAIESGSRAWGFPSPDSDYDVRLVYSRSPDWYLSIAPGRDVIELPIKDELDINGWDIKKALGLLLKPNPVLLEWLSSPIHYIWDDDVCEKLIAFSRRVSHGPACLHHYFNLGESLWKRRIEGKDEVKLKRYFYVLRPAMALRWLRMHPDTVPPMNFQKLMAGVDLDADLTEQLEILLRAKAKTKELGTAARIGLLDDFILDEFEIARERAASPRVQRHELRDEADKLFREIVMGVAS